MEFPQVSSTTPHLDAENPFATMMASFDEAGVSGVIRGILCEHGVAWGMPIVERSIPIDRLESVEEIFFTNSLRGIESLHRLRFAGSERDLGTRCADALAQRLRSEGLWQ